MNGDRADIGRSGFTLLELLAVVVIMGMIAVVAVVSLRGPIAAARCQLAVRELSLADRRARELARRTGEPGTLIFDLDAETLAHSAGGRARRPVPLTMSALRLEGARHDRGRVLVSIRADGTSPDYAVLLGGRNGPERWLLLAGATGRTWETDDEQAAESTLRIAAGADAR